VVRSFANNELDKKTVYRYEEKLEEAPAPPPEMGHEELIRKEYINPPSDFAPSTIKSHHTHHTHHSRHSSHHSKSRRAPSPSIAPSASRHLSPPRSERSHRTRGRSASEAIFSERKTVVEEQIPAPPAPPQAPEFFEEHKTIIEERVPAPSHAGTLVVQDREYRSQRDIEAEIRALESERRALRLEREDQDRMALRLRGRSEEEYQLVEYRDRRDREIIPIVERNPSPPRNVIRVEKDRKGRMALVRSAHWFYLCPVGKAMSDSCFCLNEITGRSLIRILSIARQREKQAKKIAIAMATLT
jgi:hypothetical protein